MGKPTGFIEWQRSTPTARAAETRTSDHQEIYLEQAQETILQQAGRCMDCGIPFCHQGCPLGNPIPDFNEQAYHNRWHDAYLRLATTNNLPEITGRVCPAPCETACVLAINDDPVTIEEMEKEIIERAFREGWVKPAPPRNRTSKRIAVVGSGPAGLAAAAQLSSAGHRVRVYEAADRLGGLLRYGIPDFKLEKWVIDRRLEIMQSEGIQFVTGTEVGKDPTWNDLRQQHDAVLIATGSRRPRDLEVPGRDLRGIHFAMDFLVRQNQLNAGDPPFAPYLDAAGKRVVILGGGDTGSDCVGTALRQGASAVLQIELLPEPPATRSPDNPWPQWPMIMRTSSSHEEGGEREYARMTKRVSGTDGRLTTLHTVRVEMSTSTNGNGRPILSEIPDSEEEIPADLLLLAMGFIGPETEALEEQLGIEIDPRGNVKTDATYATNIDNVFCAGDANRGQSLVVWAIAEGREAARSIDSFLRRGEAPWLPTRGVDAHFGGR